MIAFHFDQRWKDLDGVTARVIGYSCQGATMRERDRERETVLQWCRDHCVGRWEPEGEDSVIWFYDPGDATLCRLRFG